ncbi:LuxR C-terminal-related transcriptional regulator [Raoultibacter phocaeensis]|uniref:LuxR C-terminal-related transcriptional regulator n=1 Tax=Raoultibacter phocaeensis TaxID=2479841 RepID=UPI00210247A3|nr:LuxR C-terminal-related transcriptional regulator [Raoultibacter phocaeensis]
MDSNEVSKTLAAEGSFAEDQSFPYALVPLRFLGMGVFIAWLCCTHVVSIFPGSVDAPSLRATFDTSMRFGDIATFLVLAIAASRIGPISRHFRINAALVAVTAIGTVIVGLALIPGHAPESAVAAVSFVTAIGGALLFCLWAETYCQMGTMQTIVYGSLSCIAAAVVSFLISTMTEPYAIIATSLLPLGSFVCVTLSLKIVPAEHEKPNGVRFPVPWKLVALMAFAGLASGLAGSLLTNADGTGAIHRVAATGLAGVVILIMVFVRKNRCDVRFLAKTVLPVSIVAFALVPFAGPVWAFAVSFLIKLAYVWFTFFVLLMLANISYRFEVPSLRLFAIARAASEGALFVGVAVRRWVQQTELLTNDSFLFAVAIVGIVMILVCTLIWTSERSVNADWGASGISLKDSVHVPGKRERLIVRCEQLSEEYGLTAREAEILGLIAQGKSRVEIEQQLFLSQNTVKTHARHLYAKLGVHSKEDVYKLFGE